LRPLAGPTRRISGGSSRRLLSIRHGNQAHPAARNTPLKHPVLGAAIRNRGMPAQTNLLANVLGGEKPCPRGTPLCGVPQKPPFSLKGKISFWNNFKGAAEARPATGARYAVLGSRGPVVDAVGGMFRFPKGITPGEVGTLRSPGSPYVAPVQGPALGHPLRGAFGAYLLSKAKHAGPHRLAEDMQQSAPDLPFQLAVSSAAPAVYRVWAFPEYPGL
jgi:hypothetical protein